MTPDGSKPRAAWWAYRAYADTVSTRVASVSSDPCIIPFPASGDAIEARMIVARVHIDGLQSDSKWAVDVRFTGLNVLPFIEGQDRVHVKIANIPDSGEAAVDKLSIVSERDVLVGRGTASFILPPIAEHEADVITLTRPEQPQ